MVYLTYKVYFDSCHLQAPNPKSSVVRTEIQYVGQCYSFPDKSNCICVTTKSHDKWYLVAKSEVRIFLCEVSNWGEPHINKLNIHSLGAYCIFDCTHVTRAQLHVQVMYSQIHYTCIFQ